MKASTLNIWQSAPNQAAVTTIGDAECLQRIFDGKLDIFV